MDKTYPQKPTTCPSLWSDAGTRIMAGPLMVSYILENFII